MYLFARRKPHVCVTFVYNSILILGTQHVFGSYIIWIVTANSSDFYKYRKCIQNKTKLNRNEWDGDNNNNQNMCVSLSKIGKWWCEQSKTKSRNWAKSGGGTPKNRNKSRWVRLYRCENYIVRNACGEHVVAHTTTYLLLTNDMHATQSTWHVDMVNMNRISVRHSIERYLVFCFRQRRRSLHTRVSAEAAQYI